MNVAIKNVHNETLAGILEGDQKIKKIVIICHGFGANKNKPWKLRLAQELAAAGMPSLRFDFSGNGESEGTFEQATYSKELSDLFTVINWVLYQGFTKIYLVGHSMAGSIVIRAASERHGIAGVIDIEGVVYVADFEKRNFNAQQKEELQRTSRTSYVKKDGTILPVTQTFIDDTKTWNVLQTVKHLKCPLLIVHGDKDVSIPLQDSKDLYWEATCEKSMEVLPGCDHYFRSEIEQNLLARTITRWVMKHENTSF
jgi:uncharacterized protein